MTSAPNARSRPGSAGSVALAAVAAFIAGGVSVARAQDRAGLCDILAGAGTPCVAAHSTTRALYAHYAGPLYQVRRADGTSRDIGVLVSGGTANAEAQDAFCAGSFCTVTRIYDQSALRNDLTIEGGGDNGRADRGAIANALPVLVEGRRAYGLFIQAGVGYRNNDTQCGP